MSKKLRDKTQVRGQQVRKDAQRDSARETEKFYAWLGEILSEGMSADDFNAARFMFKQGISAQKMKDAGAKPYRRPR